LDPFTLTSNPGSTGQPFWDADGASAKRAQISADKPWIGVNQLRKSDICTLTSIVSRSAFNTANHGRYYITGPCTGKGAFAP
jgi:hypothetical protein